MAIISAVTIDMGYLSNFCCSKDAGKYSRQETLEVHGEGFLAANVHFFFLLLHGLKELLCAGFWGHALVLGLVHLSKWATVAGDGIDGNLRTNKAGANERHCDSIGVMLRT